MPVNLDFVEFCRSLSSLRKFGSSSKTPRKVCVNLQIDKCIFAVYNKINGSIDILCYQDLNTIEVKVIDTGSGIKEEDYDEIFKPFYRCEGINSYSKNGIGLGLSLTQSVIKLHGGEINVKSKLNEGTEFTFILPYIV